MEANRKRVEEIQKWKYNSEDKSVIYPILWKYAVSPSAIFIPEWMSPNVITVFGFLFTVLSMFMCWGKTKYSVFEVHLVCWFSFLAFFFDALDGEQGRKWRKEKRDVYVLTQLFDHGFDSLTTILNAYIVAQVLGLDLFCRKLLFLLLVSVFIVSTMEYKVRRSMIFGAFNNPTESIFGNIVLLTISSLFNVPESYKFYGVVFVVSCTMAANIYTLSKIFAIGNSNEKAEILDLGFLFITISLSLFNSSPDFTLTMIEFSALFHIMVLRLICCEIVKENCPKELFCFVLPIFLINLVGITNSAVHVGVSLFYSLYCVYVWYAETGTICRALKMNNAFSKPPVNNNPFLALTEK